MLQNQLTKFSFNAIIWIIHCNVHYNNKVLNVKEMNKMERRNVSERKVKIMEITWNYLLKNGLGHSSVGELCRDTGIAQSSLYHHFENKDDIWVSSGKYGLSKVVGALFDFTINHTGDVESFFVELLDEVEKYKHELRLGVQITTSPVLGGSMREQANDFRLLYERYAEKLTGIFNCTYSQAEVFIYSIIAYVIDYAIWDDREKRKCFLIIFVTEYSED